MGVCRRVVGNIHDAEDAFQATFLVLVRKATSVVPREFVGNWLYGVAYRSALETRAQRARHHARTKQVTDMPQPQVPPEEAWRTVQTVARPGVERFAREISVAVGAVSSARPQPQGSCPATAPGAGNAVEPFGDRPAAVGRSAGSSRGSDCRRLASAFVCRSKLRAPCPVARW